MKSEYAANLALSEGATPSTSWMKPAPARVRTRRSIWRFLKWVR